MRRTTYIASEDSAFLRKALRGRSGERSLEIGAGNCGNLLELSKGFRLVVGTDLARPSMSDWREVGVNFILADGASCFRDSVFDLVTFNPPYVVADVEDDPAVEGGRNLEVPKAFLLEGLRAVRRNGSIVFLLGDGANVEEFRDLCAEKGFGLERMAWAREFFEELTVYSAKAND
jgi:release factor glutamine methyltransferase